MLQEFNIIVKHIRGKDNLIADCLSRLWNAYMLMNVYFVYDIWFIYHYYLIHYYISYCKKKICQAKFSFFFEEGKYYV